MILYYLFTKDIRGLLMLKCKTDNSITRLKHNQGGHF